MRTWSRPDIPDLPGERPARTENAVRAFDTARGAVVPVGPAEGAARLYVCGITPYDATHLGHAFTYLTFDLLQRAWRDAGHDVVYAQNVTDVDDPLLERAQATGQDWEQLAEEQTQLFRDDMTALRIIPPDHYIGVVECIHCVEALVTDLQPSGTIYPIDDADHPDLYFATATAPGFGGVSHLDREQMIKVFAERGGDPDRPGKRDALDCLVWRTARPDEPAWETTLGHGRPGWHIECTAIALRCLGPDFDVQGGGTDLAFPHHEMCAAEGILATGEPFAQAFVHSAMVGLDGEKMSKSKGNLELVSRLRKRGADPMAIRLALLAHHYRTDWEWTPAELERAEARLAAWRAGAGRAAGPSGEQLLAELRAAMRTDLDAPRALAVIDTWCAAEGTDAAAPGLARAAADALLGVTL